MTSAASRESVRRVDRPVSPERVAFRRREQTHRLRAFVTGSRRVA
jgi:hypothetical protein